jgi:hypothetical protein
MANARARKNWDQVHDRADARLEPPRRSTFEIAVAGTVVPSLSASRWSKPLGFSLARRRKPLCSVVEREQAPTERTILNCGEAGHGVHRVNHPGIPGTSIAR